LLNCRRRMDTFTDTVMSVRTLAMIDNGSDIAHHGAGEWVCEDSMSFRHARG
jgi:hypothetical protein